MTCDGTRNTLVLFALAMKPETGIALADHFSQHVQILFAQRQGQRRAGAAIKAVCIVSSIELTG